MSPEVETVEILHPRTGEVEPIDPTDIKALVALRAEHDELIDVTMSRRSAIDDLIVARLDALNERSHRVGDYVVKTNAPTVESYRIEDLRAALDKLVKADKLAPEAAARLIDEGEPKPPTPKVRKAEVNKLKKLDDPDILRALGGARNVERARRTVSLSRAEA